MSGLTPEDPIIVIQTAMWRRFGERNTICALCRRDESPWEDENTLWIACQFCLAGFHDVCYWRLAVPAIERQAWEAHNTLDYFIGRECRS